MLEQFWRFGYAWLAAPVMCAVAPVLAWRRPNLKAGLAGRRGLWERLTTQLARRDPAKPLIWFHVASAGEFLQAQPVLERCLQQGYECAVTFTSVNGAKWIQRAKFATAQTPLIMDYLPLDSARNMRRLLGLLQPAALVYVQYDLWPNLIWEAHARGIPQYLISAIIQPHSKRYTSALSRSLYRTLYACLEGIFTATEADRQRFRDTNPDHPHLTVLGNTRFDSVVDRKRKIAPPAFLTPLQKEFVIVAGSTWPPDEACMFPVFQEALAHDSHLHLIIAPHEPTPEHVHASETAFREFSLTRFTRLTDDPAQPLPRVILVDTIGVLSSLYAVGTLAYVGGAFTTGVHNVMEPAVMGLPVMFGPKHTNSPEAVDLVQQGLAFTGQTTADFRSRVFDFLAQPAACRALGQQAQQQIEAQAGVAERCFDLITARLPRP